jgi:hypothetical protein
VLLKYCETQNQDPMVDIELKYKKATSKLQMRKSMVSIDNLSYAVKQEWEESEVAGFKMMANAVTLSRDSIYHLLKFLPQVTIADLSKGFSAFKDAEAYTCMI